MDNFTKYLNEQHQRTVSEKFDATDDQIKVAAKVMDRGTRNSFSSNSAKQKNKEHLDMYKKEYKKRMKQRLAKMNKEEYDLDDIIDVYLMETTDFKQMMKQYRRNEDKNYHTENILMLAKTFGTEKDVQKVEKIKAKNDKQGFTDNSDSKWMYDNIHKKYYPKLVQAAK